MKRIVCTKTHQNRYGYFPEGFIYVDENVREVSRDSMGLAVSPKIAEALLKTPNFREATEAEEGLKPPGQSYQEESGDADAYLISPDSVSFSITPEKVVSGPVADEKSDFKPITIEPQLKHRKRKKDDSN